MSWISSHNICTWNVSLQCAFFLFGLTLTTCLKVKIQTKCDRGNIRKIWDKRVDLRRVTYTLTCIPQILDIGNHYDVNDYTGVQANEVDWYYAKLESSSTQCYLFSQLKVTM